MSNAYVLNLFSDLFVAVESIPNSLILSRSFPLNEASSKGSFHLVFLLKARRLLLGE